MQSESSKWYEIGKRAVEGAQAGVNRENYHIMSEQEAKDVILNDPNGNILKRMEAIAVARSILGEDCTMKDIWKWAEK
jgi:hypothetical protein